MFHYIIWPMLYIAILIKKCVYFYFCWVLEHKTNVCMPMSIPVLLHIANMMYEGKHAYAVIKLDLVSDFCRNCRRSIDVLIQREIYRSDLIVCM